MSTIKKNGIVAVPMTITFGALCLSATASAAPVGGGSHAPITSQQLFAKYRSFSSLQATINSNIVLQPTDGGTPNNVASTMIVSYKKPNLVHIDEQGLMGGGEVVSNGQTIYTYSALTNQYSVAAAPHDLLESFVFGKSGSSDLKLAGHTFIDGKPMSDYHGTIHSSRGDAQVDMYIDDSTKLFRRVVAHINQLPGPQGGKFRMTMTQDFLNQKINTPISAGLFKFTPPSDAKEGAVGSMSGIPGMSGS